MTVAAQILQATDSVLVIDWPSRDVPEALAKGGYTVLVKSGPEPGDYSAYELLDGEVVARRVGRPPEHADLIYFHRPLDELPSIVAIATSLGARAVWHQSGLMPGGRNHPEGCWVPRQKSQQARKIVEEAGLTYVEDTYIADGVRELGARDDQGEGFG